MCVWGGGKEKNRNFTNGLNILTGMHALSHTYTLTHIHTYTYLEVRSEGVQYRKENKTNFIGERPLYFGVEFNFIAGDLVDGEGERGRGVEEGGGWAGNHCA